MARKRILIAEDDVHLSALLADILQAAGNDVTEVQSGDKALDALSTGHYDLLISDVMMPPPLGVHVAAMMRTAGTEVPILVITASKQPEIANIVSRMKHAQLLYKPFTRAELITRVEELVGPTPRSTLDVESRS